MKRLLCCVLLQFFTALSLAQTPTQSAEVAPPFRGAFYRKVICQDECYEKIWIIPFKGKLLAFVEYVSKTSEIGDYSRTFEEKAGIKISRVSTDATADFYLLDNDSRLKSAKDETAIYEKMDWSDASNELIASDELVTRKEIKVKGEPKPEYEFARYPASQANDSDPKTAWAVKGGPKEFLVTLFKKAMAPKFLVIQNGYAKSPQTFANNNRVKSCKLTYSDGEAEILSLQDSSSPQRIALQRKTPTDFVKLEILEVYRGIKYDETCISELDFE